MDAFITISPVVPVETPEGNDCVFADYEHGGSNGHSSCTIA